MIQRFAFWLLQKLKRWALPHPDSFVLAMTLQTAALELTKGDYIELAPIKGCCGPFKLSGNSLPVFEYIVFEKKLMEFILIRVEISKPDRIQFRATIESKNTGDPVRHGEEVECKASYKAPFELLSWHLFQYFPFYLKQSEPSLVRVRQIPINVIPLEEGMNR